MAATTLSAGHTYQAMLNRQITPAMRNLDLVGSRGTYRLDEWHWHAGLGFQKSRNSDADEASFTINLSVVRRADWERAIATDDIQRLPMLPAPNAQYAMIRGLWTKRIGHLLPIARDHWWRITAGQDTAALADEIVSAIHDFALPALRERIGH